MVRVLVAKGGKRLLEVRDAKGKAAYEVAAELFPNAKLTRVFSELKGVDY